jgi:hypothetical protein
MQVCASEALVGAQRRLLEVITDVVITDAVLTDVVVVKVEVVFTDLVNQNGK